jgi:hypothetical protein
MRGQTQSDTIGAFFLDESTSLRENYVFQEKEDDWRRTGQHAREVREDSEKYAFERDSEGDMDLIR